MYCSTKYINILLYYCSLELTGNQSYTTSTHIPIHHTPYTLAQTLEIYKGNEFRHIFCFFNTYIFATHCRIPLIFQIINSGGSNSQSLKYQRFKLKHPCCKDIGMRQFELVTITQFLKR